MFFISGAGRSRFHDTAAQQKDINTSGPHVQTPRGDYCMSDTIDYDDLSEKTISQIKEEVEEKDIDLEKLLETEKQNKDRKTLKSWLEDRIDDTEDDVSDEHVEEPDESSSDEHEDDSEDQEERVEEMDSVTDDQPGLVARIMGSLKGWSIPKAFLLGLLIGGLFTAAFSGPSTGPSTAEGETLTQSEVREDLQPYVDQLSSQYSQLLGSEPEITHVNSGQAEFADLYEYTYQISVQNPNSSQDMTQEFELYASKTGSHVLQAQPLNQQQGSGSQLPQ